MMCEKLCFFKSFRDGSWTLINILICFLLLNTVEAKNRYRLQNVYQDSAKNTYTEVYLDTSEQRVVVKEFSTDYSFLPRTIGTTYPIISEGFDGVERNGATFTRSREFDLESSTGQKELNSFYQNIEPLKSESAYREVIHRIRTGPSRYKLLKSNASKNSNIGLYLNESTGEIVFKAVREEDGNNRDLINSAGLLTDLKALKEGQSSLAFQPFKVRTIHQLNQAKEKIKRLYGRSGLRVSDLTFENLKEKVENFEKNLSQINIKEGPQGVFQEILYNSETREVIVRRYILDNKANQSSSKQITEEIIFDLKDDVGVSKALSEFKDIGRDGKRIKNYLFIVNGICEKNITDHNPMGESNENSLKDFQKIAEFAWKNRLNTAIPESLNVLEGNSFEIDVDILGKQQPLKGQLDKNGNLINLDFLNPNQIDNNQLRIQKFEDTLGNTRFLLQALNEVNNEWEGQVLFESEMMKDSNSRIKKPRLAVHLKGKQGDSDFDFNDFEKSSYDLIMRGGELESIADRVRYNGERENEYNKLRPRGGGGLFMPIINIGFKFYGRDARGNAIREEVIKKANVQLRDPSSGLDVNFTDTEINSVADDVVEETSKRTDGLRNNLEKIKAVATEESFSRFGELVLERILKDLLPEEPNNQIKEMVDLTMTEFRRCLKKASDASSAKMAEDCLNVFMKEGPIDVGKEILKSKIQKAEVGDYFYVAEREYLACIQENYDPYKAKKDARESIAVVQSCLYKAIVITVDRVAPAIIDKKLSSIGSELGLTLSYSPTELRDTRTKARKCLKDAKLANFGAIGIQVDAKEIGKLEADQFEQSLNKCINHIVEDVANNVAKVALDSKLVKADLPDDVRNTIANESFDSGFTSCVETQKRAIESGINLYSEEKQALKYKKSTQKVSVKVPKFRPEECERILSSTATGKATVETLKTMLGESYSEVLKKESFNPETCFNKHNKYLIESVDDWLLENSKLSEEQLKEKTEERDQLAEVNTVNCIKEAINVVSYYVAQDMVSEKLSENPNYADINLSPEVKNAIGESVRSCFKEELTGINNVDEVLEKQKELQDYCGANLLKDRNVAPLLFTPFVEKGLGNIEMTKETKAKATKRVMDEILSSLDSQQTLEGALSVLDDANRIAVPVVLNEVLNEQIQKVVGSTDDKDKATVKEMVELVQKDIFAEDGQGELGKKLIKAMDEKNQEDLERVISSIELRAAELLGPKLITQEAETMLEDGTLDSKEDVDFVIEEGTKALKKCLSKPYDEKKDDLIGFCKKETTLNVTELIFKKKIDEKLTQDPLLARAINPEDKEKIIGDLVNQKRMNELKSILDIPDQLEGKKAMNNFVLSFKVDATEKIVGDLISPIFERKLPSQKYFDKNQKIQHESLQNKLATDAKNKFSQCVTPLKDKIAKKDLSASETDLDTCLNEMRFNLTETILPKRFQTILTSISSKDEDNKQRVDKALEEFRNCSKKKDKNTKSSEYGDYIDGCLMSGINNFIDGIITSLQESDPQILKASQKPLSWDFCREDLKKRALSHVYPEGGFDNKVFELPEVDFYAEMNRVGKTRRPPQIPGEEWILPNLLDCALKNLLPQGLSEVKDAFLDRNGENLSPEAKSNLLALSNSLDEILTSKDANGNKVLFDFSPFEKLFSSSAKPEPLFERLPEIDKNVVDFLNELSAYDNERTQKGIQQLREMMLNKIKSTEGEVPTDTLVNTLLESDLSDLLVEALISQKVKKQTKEALTERNIKNSDEISDELAAKNMINRLYSSDEGRRAIDQLKQKYIKPLLLGNLDDKKIPPELMEKVTRPLYTDLKPGGFVESLFRPIVQNSLKENSDLIEKWWPVAKPWAILVERVNPDTDFNWGEKNIDYKKDLRLTKSGQEALRLFANEILRPRMIGNNSDTNKKCLKNNQKNKDCLTNDKAIEQKINKLIKQGMREN